MKNKIVLVFQATTINSNLWRFKLAGTYQYAAKAHWHIQLVQCGVTEEEIQKMLDIWQPIGCIADHFFSDDQDHPDLFKGIPVVYIEQNPATASSKCFNVVHDSEKTAQMGALELLNTGIEKFSFVPHGLDVYWNRAREKTLEKTVRKAGKEFIPWGATPFDPNCSVIQQDELLAERLSTLPKPIGLLCSIDNIAHRVANIASKLKIAIPDDLVIVGIDNDELVCENTYPTITSVQPDFQACGYMAAELLDRRIHNPKMKPVTLKYGPIQIVRRKSTRRFQFANSLVSRAMKIIAEKALNSDFHTDDLAKELGCSRSLLDLRFKENSGFSIRQTVQNFRFERAISLLRDPSQNIAAIPKICGYSSSIFFKRLFKRRTGMSMREWRKKNVKAENGQKTELT